MQLNRRQQGEQSLGSEAKWLGRQSAANLQMMTRENRYSIREKPGLSLFSQFPPVCPLNCSAPAGGLSLREQLFAIRFAFHFASFAAASVLAFVRTLASDTGAPPWRLLSSAASMKAKIPIVSSALTGG